MNKSKLETGIRAELAMRQHFKAGQRNLLTAVLALIRPSELPMLAAMDAAALAQASNVLTRYAVLMCERELTKRENDRRTRYRKRVNTIANFYGLNAHTNGDPRGAVVKLFGEPLSFAQIDPVEGITV